MRPYSLELSSDENRMSLRCTVPEKSESEHSSKNTRRARYVRADSRQQARDDSSIASSKVAKLRSWAIGQWATKRIRVLLALCRSRRIGTIFHCITCGNDSTKSMHIPLLAPYRVNSVAYISIASRIAFTLFLRLIVGKSIRTVSRGISEQRMSE